MPFLRQVSAHITVRAGAAVYEDWFWYYTFI